MSSSDLLSEVKKYQSIKQRMKPQKTAAKGYNNWGNFNQIINIIINPWRNWIRPHTLYLIPTSNNTHLVILAHAFIMCICCCCCEPNRRRLGPDVTPHHSRVQPGDRTCDKRQDQSAHGAHTGLTTELFARRRRTDFLFFLYTDFYF